MLKHVEHIGIAVNNAASAAMLYEKLLGCKPYKTEEVKGENVKTVFFQTGETKIELLEATSEESAIQQYINKKGEGVHHIAFEVENIEEEIARLQSEGFTFITESIRNGADNKRITFLHPKSANGVLIELCQPA